MTQWDWQHLGSPGIQAPSPAQHDELRIWRCCSCGLGCKYGSDLIPGLGTPYATGRPKKRKKKKKVKEVLEFWKVGTKD